VKPFGGKKESTGDLEGIKGKVVVEGEREKGGVASLSGRTSF
jgi:hypothetical protein